MNLEFNLPFFPASVAAVALGLVMIALLGQRLMVSRRGGRSCPHGHKYSATKLGELMQRVWATISCIQSDVMRHREEINDATIDLTEQAKSPIEPELLLSTLTFIADANRRLESRLQAAEAQLRNQAKQLEEQWLEVRSDPLTGLANRRVFDTELARRLKEYRKYGAQFALALYDIDHFKQINDRDGHKTGDAILIHVARAMQFDIPEGALIARIGGEEFAVLLPHQTMGETLALAERIRTCPSSGFGDQPASVVSLSCGVAICQEGDTETSLFDRSDRALYAAKRSGRNATFFDCGDRCVRYSPPSSCSTKCAEDSSDYWPEETAVAWHEDPEAQALVDVLRQKLSDLKILE
ncbi:MAG: GGDEF domain-containing protein [Thermogutta sp.]